MTVLIFNALRCIFVNIPINQNSLQGVLGCKSTLQFLFCCIRLSVTEILWLGNSAWEFLRVKFRSNAFFGFWFLAPFDHPCHLKSRVFPPTPLSHPDYSPELRLRLLPWMPEQKRPTLIHPAAREEKTFGRYPVNNNKKKTANAEMQHVSLFIICMYNLDENKKYIYNIHLR